MNYLGFPQLLKKVGMTMLDSSLMGSCVDTRNPHLKVGEYVIQKKNIPEDIEKNINKLVEESVDDKFTGKHQWICRGKILKELKLISKRDDVK
jgi:hypothetical protein